jgi:DNA-binding transcriptional ArsR family regulator
MRGNAPGLLPILRSRHLAEMLTLLLLHPDTEYTLSEVAGKLGPPLTTVQRKASRLADSGLIKERRVGRSRLVSANPASRYTRPLTELVSLAFGSEFVIGEEFGILGALAVAIYGSWAARYAGTAGPAPNDVDVLVIGDLPPLRYVRGGRALRAAPRPSGEPRPVLARAVARKGRPAHPAGTDGSRCLGRRRGTPARRRRLMRWSTGEASSPS